MSHSPEILADIRVSQGIPVAKRGHTARRNPSRRAVYQLARRDSSWRNGINPPDKRVIGSPGGIPPDKLG
jgi:hypothetical protein